MLFNENKKQQEAKKWRKNEKRNKHYYINNVNNDINGNDIKSKQQ